MMAEDVPNDAEHVFGPGKKPIFGETGHKPAKGFGRRTNQYRSSEVTHGLEASRAN
jgi:hypothetical protein